MNEFLKKEITDEDKMLFIYVSELLFLGRDRSIPSCAPVLVEIKNNPDITVLAIIERDTIDESMLGLRSNELIVAGYNNGEYVGDARFNRYIPGEYTSTSDGFDVILKEVA